jgi:hypothetical protein
MICDTTSEGVYETEHEPEVRVQEDDGENVPLPLLAHLIVPVGRFPFTVATHSEALLTVAGEGEQVTEVRVIDGAKLSEISAQPSFVAG